MVAASRSIVIDRPIEAVFDFIARGENNAAWRPGVVAIAKRPGSPDGLGAEYSQTLKVPVMGKVAGDYRITEFVRPIRIAFQVTAGPARPRGSYAFAPEGEGTRVAFSLEFQPRGLQRLMSRMIQSSMDKEVAAISRLKAVLEAAP